MIVPMRQIALAAVAALSLAAPGRAEPVQAQNGRAALTEGALVFSPQDARFRAAILPDHDAAARPILPEGASGPATRLLRDWQAQGRASGLAGVLYDNRDRGHSALSPSDFPQLTHLDYDAALRDGGRDLGLADQVLFDAVTIGNSSTALSAGPAARGLPRLAMTTPDGPARAAQTAFANHLYVYPVWRDMSDAQDRLPAALPYFVATLGASYTDEPFLRAFALTLASMPPDVHAQIEAERLVVPTLQMLLRRSLAGVTDDAAYLTARAHPPAFDGTRLRPEQMMAMANRLTPETVPPRVILRVEDEDFAEAAGLAGLSERLFDTPEAVARIWRGWQGRRSVTLAASTLPRGRATRIDWALLQGDPARVQITPLAPDGARVRVTVDWHGRFAAGREGRESDRVEIAAFAWNGHHHSAPAYFAIAFPGHQVRHYAPDADGKPRLQSIDYDAVARAASFDPLLHYSAPWTDRAHHAPVGTLTDGTLTGWTRTTAGQTLRLDAAAHLSDGGRVHYVLDEVGAHDARLLRMEVR